MKFGRHLLLVLCVGAGLLRGGGAEGAPSFRALSELPSEFTTSLAKPLPESKIFKEQSLQFPLPNWARGHLSLADHTASYFEPGMPGLPSVSESFEVPESETVQVSLEKVSLEATEEAVPLLPVKGSHIWGTEAHFTGAGEKKGRFFPGPLFRSRQIGNRVYVTLFPIQIERDTGQVYALRGATLKVETLANDDGRYLSPLENSPGGAESLILVRENFKPAALLLADFQRRHAGVSTEIYSIESIEALETPVAETSLPPGIKDHAETGNLIPYDARTGKGYDYKLARQIISFLQRRMGGTSRTRYVTLLGTAAAIPPSYYVELPKTISGRLAPTDGCYGSRGGCTEPWLAVGRLPFNSLSEMGNYLAKAESWMRTKPPSELSLFGGKAFPLEEVYVGELSALRLLDSEKADWSHVQKNLRTLGNFSKTSLIKAFEGTAESALLYIVDHGYGNELAIENESLTSKEISELPILGENFPLVVSVACSNAAFDSSNISAPVLGPVAKGRVSFGEALLASPAGAIGYLGATREVEGSPVYKIDDHGNLSSVGSTYFLQLLEGVMESYRAQKQGRVGDHLLSGLRRYFYETGNDPGDVMHLWTYLAFEYLGDPTLPLPMRNHQEALNPVAKSVMSLLPSNGEGFPRWNLASSEAPYRLKFESGTKGKVTWFKVKAANFLGDYGEEIIAQGETDFGGEISAGLIRGELYFVRIENEVGVPAERQIWFRAE